MGRRVTKAVPAHRRRCSWASREPLMTYHDVEWGTPLHDHRRVFHAGSRHPERPRAYVLPLGGSHSRANAQARAVEIRDNECEHHREKDPAAHIAALIAAR